MPSDNHTSIVGNLVEDPELRFTNNGTPVANLRVAVTQRVQDKDGSWRDGETSFFTVNVWRGQADFGHQQTSVEPLPVGCRQDRTTVLEPTQTSGGSGGCGATCRHPGTLRLQRRAPTRIQ